jgi:hypothetical protein
MEFVERMEELIDGYQPDIMLPEQYNELIRRHHESSGELKLLVAVLEDAIHCYLDYGNADTRQRRLVFYEVRQWINSTNSNGLFAYDTLCEALGINAFRLRTVLERQRHHIMAGRIRARKQRTWATRGRQRLLGTRA